MLEFKIYCYRFAVNKFTNYLLDEIQICHLKRAIVTLNQFQNTRLPFAAASLRLMTFF